MTLMVRVNGRENLEVYTVQHAGNTPHFKIA